jgi:hypothetical protein
MGLLSPSPTAIIILLFKLSRVFSNHYLILCICVYSLSVIFRLLYVIEPLCLPFVSVNPLSPINPQTSHPTCPPFAVHCRLVVVCFPFNLSQQARLGSNGGERFTASAISYFTFCATSFLYILHAFVNIRAFLPPHTRTQTSRQRASSLTYSASLPRNLLRAFLPPLANFSSPPQTHTGQQLEQLICPTPSLRLICQSQHLPQPHIRLSRGLLPRINTSRDHLSAAYAQT